MKLCEKLEILIRRNGMKKTEFAANIGITYRALANYLNGGRIPREAILKEMAKQLDTTTDFLRDDSKTLVLNSEEKFLFNGNSNNRSKQEATDFLEQSRGLFAGNNLSDTDKTALFACLTEIYFDAKTKAKKFGKKTEKDD